MEKPQPPNSILAKLFLYIFIFITICNLIFNIKTELKNEKVASFNQLKKEKEKFFSDLKNVSDLGWFNLKDCSIDYEKETDIHFVSFQYMVVPTILEEHGYNKKIICFYTSPKQLTDFCEKKKKYKIIEKNILTSFALLERED